ncbi:DUF2569 family protein [Qipengyuania aquimaris]|uniref:DUF2569 family protein n=1 Tax=Qipengyuania aquimaris TaxID=255984 RepID=UPI001CD7491F|nr:DUF2569 family protein [Qipengyuania aquimaris]MCA0903707.1 DUF2569 family protein [Qipengyuania aquimaris]
MAITRWIEAHLNHLAVAWVSVMALLSVAKLVKAGRLGADIDWLALAAIPYLAIIIAPLLGFLLARAAFQSIDNAPGVRLALFGRWRSLRLKEAHSHPLYGTTGFLTSLLVGLLFGIVMRTGEFFMIQPALLAHAPAWSHILYLAMAAELAMMNFFYMVCFVLALRRVPLFPKMLAYVWILDILAQVAIAGSLSGVGLPVEVAEPLGTLLMANMNTVMVSIFIWMPYLLLSDRVNVTFRQRVSASA